MLEEVNGMTIANKYDIGDQVILHAETRVDTSLVSVTGVFKVKIPGSDTLATVTANENPTGTFEGFYVPVVSGRHFYRFIASGAQTGQEEFWFDVRERHA